jgi:hypothetical protein
MISTVASRVSGSRATIVGQHADGDEEQHREGVAQRQRLLRRALAQLGLAEDHAGEERPKCEGDIEQRSRAEGDTERNREHGEAEQLARAGMGHVMQYPRDHAFADDQHDGDEGRDLGRRDRDRNRQRDQIEARARLEKRGKRRQQHEREHHREILDDEPADGDAAALGLEQAPFLHRPQQHDRARHRQGQTEHEARAHGPAQSPRERHPECGGDRDLRNRSGDGDAPDREQVFERKMQSNAEHQEDHADLGELVRNPLVGDIARGERADEDAGDEITDKRGKPQPLCQHAEAECEHQRNHDRRDQRSVMRHWRSSFKSLKSATLLPAAPRLVRGSGCGE